MLRWSKLLKTASKSLNNPHPCLVLRIRAGEAETVELVELEDND